MLKSSCELSWPHSWRFFSTLHFPLGQSSEDPRKDRLDSPCPAPALPWNRCVSSPIFLKVHLFNLNISFFNHSYFVGFKLLSCFCSQNLFKLSQIHPVFACKALDVAYLLSVRHIKTIPTSNAILAFTWKSSDFSSSLKTIICFKRFLYSI